MPELPEVETMVRGIGPHIVGRTIAALEACPTTCRPITLRPALRSQASRAVGQTIIAVRRRAKRVVIELDSGWAFVIEPRMTGLVLLSDPPDPEHLRLVWRFEDTGAYPALWFWDRRGLGTVSLLDAKALQQLLEGGRLGVDALEMTDDDWIGLCTGTSREIKVAMLDQQRVAGIGNLYASEILHRAGVSPRRRANGLRRREILAIAQATREILHEAIRYEGSTLADGTYRNALNKSGGYQNAHRVYAREGEACPACGVPIRRIVQAQRATFFCPACQKPSSSRTPRSA